MSLLQIKNLNIDFPMRHSTFHAVKNVSMDISPGEVVGVVGESGAGKSTVGNAIINLLSVPGRIASGDIYLQNTQIAALDDTHMQSIRGRRIGLISQDPMTSLNPLFTVGDQLVETMIQGLKISKQHARTRAIELLQQVGISDAQTRIDQYPHQFSGGMRQRVVIAIALCCNPQLVIADEPTTALDVSVQDKILHIIKTLCKDRQIGVMLITHDMGVIANTADRVIVMYNGEIVEQGTAKHILHTPEHPYTKALISAVPPSQKKIDRFPLVQHIESEDDTLPSIDIKHHWLGQKAMDDIGDDILQVKNVSLLFKVKDSLLAKNRTYVKANQDVSFHIRKGTSFGLVGESGSGKSTIARVIAGLYTPQQGQVLYNGTNLTALSERQRRPYRQDIQMIFQNPYSSLNAKKTIYDIIAEPILFHKIAEKHAVPQIVNDLLNHVKLGSAAAHKYPHEFSGGQRQRISIARALATRPSILICDEPTSALDVSVQAQILNLLKDLQDQMHLTMLFITHDLPVVRQMCDHIAVMQHGKIIESAATNTVFENPTHPYTAELLELMPSLDKAKARL